MYVSQQLLTATPIAQQQVSAQLVWQTLIWLMELTVTSAVMFMELDVRLAILLYAWLVLLDLNNTKTKDALPHLQIVWTLAPPTPPELLWPAPIPLQAKPSLSAKPALQDSLGQTSTGNASNAIDTPETVLLANLTPWNVWPAQIILSPISTEEPADGTLNSLTQLLLLDLRTQFAWMQIFHRYLIPCSVTRETTASNARLDLLGILPHELAPSSQDSPSV